MSEYKILKLLEGKVGFPQAEWIGHENHATYMAMDLLGPNLEDLFHLCGQKFSLKTVLMLADQMVLPGLASCTSWSSCTQSTSSTATSSPKTSSWVLRRRPTSCIWLTLD